MYPSSQISKARKMYGENSNPQPYDLLHCRNDSSADMPPLCSAAITGNLEKIESLLRDGANIESKAKGGMTALMLAAIFGHEAIIEKLLQYGADTESRNAAGLRARDMIDTNSDFYTTPFYDCNSLQNRQIPWSNFSVDVPSAPRVDFSYQDFVKQESILKRRNKSLPKINIHHPNSPSALVSKAPSHSVRSQSSYNRYSPYWKASPHFADNRSKTSSANAQNLSPSVAKFFGNAMQAISPAAIRSPFDEVFFPNSSPSVANSDACPVLRELLKDHGFEHLISLFEQEEIKYQIFGTLSDADLQQIGVASKKDRNGLLRIISRCGSYLP